MECMGGFGGRGRGGVRQGLCACVWGEDGCTMHGVLYVARVLCVV